MRALSLATIALMVAACEPCPEGYQEAGPDLCGRWVPGPRMLHPRYGHTATKLLDGRVLFVGGPVQPTNSASTAEIYDPESNVFIEATPPLTSRNDDAAALLPDGRVLISGATCEIYDPAIDAWVEAPAHLDAGFARHVLVALPTGRAIVVSGSRTQVLEPGAVSWVEAAAMPTERSFFMSALLGDGRLATIGGFESGEPSYATVELLDTETLTWEQGTPMSDARYDASIALLEDGRVLVVGGRREAQVYVESAEIYDPSQDRWTRPAAALPRWGAAATVLRDGLVLVSGGRRDTTFVDEIEFFSGDHASVGPSLTAIRALHSAVVLDDGVLVAAGGVEGADGGEEDRDTEILETTERR